MTHSPTHPQTLAHSHTHALTHSHTHTLTHTLAHSHTHTRTHSHTHTRRTAVDPASRVVEFESLGTGVRNTKRFFVMNPTNASYKFRWECEDGTGAAVAHLAQAFKCVPKP